MTSNPRVVFDTNVLVSAAFSELGNPRKSLYKPRLLRYLDEHQRRIFLGWMRSRGRFVEVTETIRACSDPDDDKFLELAVSSEADVVVTGNIRDFPPSPFRDILILRPAEFLEMFDL